MLSEKQKRFIAEYARSGDAPAAAVAAGYSARRARRQAGELLRRPEIAAAAAEARETEARGGVTLSRVLRELERIAFDSAEVRDGDKLRALEMLTKLFPPDAGDDGPQTGVVILPEIEGEGGERSPEGAS